MSTTIGQRIRRAREEADLTQEELADKVGLSRSAVAQWESRRNVSPTAGNARKLAKKLGLRFEWLTMGTGPMYAGVEEEAAKYEVSRELPEDLQRLIRHLLSWPEERRLALMQSLGLE